jgi:hypothetical protein
MSNYPLLTRILSSCVQISRRAGQLLHQVKLQASTKTLVDYDYLSTALELSKICITKSLHGLYPKLNLCYCNKFDTVSSKLTAVRFFLFQTFDFNRIPPTPL